MSENPRRMAMITVVPGQPQKNAELIEILKADEKPSVYDLDDGTQLRLRTAVVEVWRVIGERDPDGNPMYVMKAQGNMTVLAPPELRQGSDK